jgi:hypothetical protein
MYGKAADKFIPACYKVASIEERFQLLAGLLDSDGYFSTGGYDYISKSKRLAEDLVFLCRSLGLAAYMKSCIKGYGSIFRAEYFRVSISGDCSVIPCRVARKKASVRQLNKNVLRTGFTVQACFIEQPGKV